jgi:hypothetical protein
MATKTAVVVSKRITTGGVAAAAVIWQALATALVSEADLIEMVEQWLQAKSTKR